MSLDGAEETIEGQRVRVAMLGARQARALLLRLAKVLGPVAAHIEDGKLDGVTMLAALSTNASDADLEFVCDALGKVSQIEQEPGSDRWVFLTLERQDTIFKGRMRAMFGWLGFALKVQFSDFFGGSASA